MKADTPLVAAIVVIFATVDGELQERPKTNWSRS